MKQTIAHVAVLVNDYDEAIAFYVNKLQFVLLEDTVLNKSKRWVLVAPKGGGCALLLAKASSEAQAASVGKQAGGRVFLFLYTDDFKRDYTNLLKNNVTIIRQPVEETYGTVCVFEDLYGNPWDLIEPVNNNV